MKLRRLSPEFGCTNTSARPTEAALVFHVVVVLQMDSKTLKSDLLKASAVQKCHSMPFCKRHPLHARLCASKKN